ncbi:CDP-diacylglycerol--serine O-phosphatidyltransferase [Halobacteriales archaeon QS_1_68_17]|nr:MAG: CDP-diacylglycerol--serine O-phosphatidyltransferase [Halobacteriales archaeon QS_1_68_17]
MQPRFVGRLGPADVVTVANATLGFLAAVVAALDPALAARAILLAAVADGLDGVLARRYGGSKVGEFVDSLADVASFCVAPAVFVFNVARAAWDVSLTDPTQLTLVALVLPALFVAAGVTRLGLYTAYDVGERYTEGVQTTLAATVLAAAYLAGIAQPAVLLGATVVFSYLMVTTVRYPELYARDAVGMGVVQSLAIAVPAVAFRVFPRLLLVAALAYLALAPRYYWRE